MILLLEVRYIVLLHTQNWKLCTKTSKLFSPPQLSPYCPPHCNQPSPCKILHNGHFKHSFVCNSLLLPSGWPWGSVSRRNYLRIYFHFPKHPLPPLSSQQLMAVCHHITVKHSKRKVSADVRPQIQHFPPHEQYVPSITLHFCMLSCILKTFCTEISLYWPL